MTPKPDATDHTPVLDECSSYQEWCEREGFDPLTRTYRRPRPVDDVEEC